MSRPRRDGLRDLSADELRAAAPLKWALDDPDVIPAWVAEMDLAIADPILRAVQARVGTGVLGYPAPARATGVVEAFVGFVQRRFGWVVDPESVLLTGDVMEGIRLTLEHLAEPGPVIVPTPVYPPFLVMVRALGRELLTVPLVSDGGRFTLDVQALGRAVAAGGRTLLLCHPHNPVGRVWSRAELAAVRDVVEPAGVRVISDEIHAALAHPGVEFAPYATVASPGAPVTTITSATKAFNMPGLRTAQLISSAAGDHSRIAALHPVFNHGMTTLGQVAAAAAYRHGEPWLDLVRERIAANHALFTAQLAQVLPSVQVHPAESTYLAWLDVSALRLDDPAGMALSVGRVRVDAQDYGPGGAGHVRVNLATSTERVREITVRLRRAWAHNGQASQV